MTGSEKSQVQVCEVFRSLQGETSWAGRPATFLRLAGCNLRCRYCDTQYAQAPGASCSIAELVAAIEHPGELVVVTGGEPLIQPGTRPLLAELVRAGHTVLLETNGSQDIDGLPPQVVRVVDIKCPGSGESESNRWQTLQRLRSSDEVKFVVMDRPDFEFAMDIVDRYELEGHCTVLLSPVVEVLEPSTLAGWILERGGPLRLQLQLHRILWPGQTRGV